MKLSPVVDGSRLCSPCLVRSRGDHQRLGCEANFRIRLVGQKVGVEEHLQIHLRIIILVLHLAH